MMRASSCWIVLPPTVFDRDSYWSSVAKLARCAIWRSRQWHSCQCDWRYSALARLNHGWAKNETPIELPFGEDAGDEEVAVDFSEESDIVAWSIGFVDAMYGDEASDWFEDEETAEDVAVLTLPMIVLSGIDDEDPELAEMRADEDKMAQMANSIEGNLTELFLLFHTND